MDRLVQAAHKRLHFLIQFGSQHSAVEHPVHRDECALAQALEEAGGEFFAVILNHAQVIAVIAGADQQGVSHLFTLFKLGVAVPVDHQVDALDILQHISGPVGRALGIHAQVDKGHNQLGSGGLQLIHLRLGGLEQLFALQELDAAHLVRVGLGGSLRGGQAEHADLQTGLCLEHRIGLKGHFLADGIQDAG